MNTEEIANEIRKTRMRVTPQRITIAEYMNSTHDHPSAEQVYKAVRQIHPAISLSTVYKTLEMLKLQGVVSEISMSTGSRYDTRRTPHLNLICTQCGVIEDLEDDFVNDLFEHVSQASTYEVNSFDMHGLCGTCRN